MANHTTDFITNSGFTPIPHRLIIHDVTPDDILRAKCENKVLPITGGITIKSGNDHITPTQSENIISAVQYAEHTNRPMNCHITINIGTTPPEYPFMEKYITAIKSNILQYYARYTRRHELKSAYVWVIENPNRTNPHLHMLVHMPMGHYPIIKKKIQSRLAKKFNMDTTEYRGGKSRQVYFKQLNTLYYNTFATSPVVGLVKYMLKGGCESPRGGFHTRQKNEIWDILQSIKTSNQGIFYCQRCGVSRNIDRQSRIIHTINTANENKQASTNIKTATDIMTANLKRTRQQHHKHRQQALAEIKAKNKANKDPP